MNKAREMAKVFREMADLYEEYANLEENEELDKLQKAEAIELLTGKILVKALNVEKIKEDI